MKSLHTPAAVFAAFDDVNLLAHGGLAPLVRLAERCGLAGLVRDKVHLTGAANSAGCAADAKVMSLVAGMLAGADSIDDMDVLRHGAMTRAYGGMRAPSTLGTFLRAFTWGHVRQLQSAIRAFTCRLAGHCNLLPGGDQIVYLDIDSKVKQVYGAAKQGAEHGYTKVRGLHFQIVTASTPIAAPVIVASRLRKGSAGSGKGAASLITEAISAVRAMGATGQLVALARRAGTVVDGRRPPPAHLTDRTPCPPTTRRTLENPPPERPSGNAPRPEPGYPPGKRSQHMIRHYAVDPGSATCSCT
ncbi:transposase [Streptomyces sp. NPDC058625]|uniref:transposase n=1 Tax=Streptomyces sp. NPDC058625 TaxID=3346564 RepID=UPI00364D29E4